MPIERQKFLSKLQVVAPALATNELLPINTHLCFTKTHVFASCDAITIVAPLKTEFEGAVPGSTLLDLLKASKAKEISCEQFDTNFKIKAGSASLKLGFLEPSSFSFDLETDGATDPAKKFPVASVAEFLSGVQSCLKSVSGDTSRPEYMGVSIIPDGKTCALFASNEQTITTAEIDLKSSVTFKRRVIISEQFCKEMLSLSKGAKKLHLEIHDDRSIFVADDVTLYGRLIEPDSKPIDFAAALQYHIPKDIEKTAITIPSKLTGIIDRASIISSARIDETATVITVKDGVAKFLSSSPRGEITDYLQVPTHPKATIRLPIKYVKAGLGDYEQIRITDDCIIMRSPGRMYMIASF